MKAFVVVFLLLAAVALAAPNHEFSDDRQDIDPVKKTTSPKTTKPPKTTTTHKPTTTTHHKSTTSPPPNTVSATPATTTEGSDLPPTRGDYVLVGNYGYYKLHKEYKNTWAEAWEACIKDDAHLLVVRSQDEYDDLYRWIPSEMPPYVYYGAHHRYANQKFVTIFDEPLETIPYHKFGWDYSNATLFNNKDYPVLLIDLSISWGSKGIYLTREDREMYQFVCKQDI